ncbi:MAG: hypothetical protein U1E51_16230 [Candidatus Binatia bacterium]|nr:hypothetical protein [Candidatus Binatia bacterium]
MRIYLAGMIQTGFVWRGNSRSENVLLTDAIRKAYPYDLESYHYLRDTKNAPAYFHEIKKTIFLDSGAFSMFTQKIKVDLGEYAGYIKKNQDFIHVASNLDVIGRGKEQQTWINQKTLEKMGAKIQPVHHARDDDKWLLKYMAEGYDYVFLGGMVPETSKYLKEWLDHIFGKYLTRKDGSAKIKVHGFGLTTVDLMRRYPWYSVDSTSWVLAGRFGNIYLDLPHGDAKIYISDQSPARRDWDRHYDTLSPVARKHMDDFIIKNGYKPELLRTHYGWRDHWNIAFFQRMMNRPDPVFIQSRQAASLF